AIGIYSGKRRLDEQLRRPEISGWASRISRLKCVRDYLTHCQRQLGKIGNIVAEGRDMTTIVFPDAPVRVFLQAELKVSTKTPPRVPQQRDHDRPSRSGGTDSGQRRS
ncbi:MAG TPA: (d)CMP kinase, partial [Syntrophobacteraceae bacterium]|nr:(d)CMP kinase [Syntrophobacteraceae bacterium]